MVSYAGAAIECRDPKYAAPLFDRLAPWADQWSTAGVHRARGPVSHFLGGLAAVLGRYAEADAYFAQAAATSERTGEVLRCPYRPHVGEDAGRTPGSG